MKKKIPPQKSNNNNNSTKKKEAREGKKKKKKTTKKQFFFFFFVERPKEGEEKHLEERKWGVCVWEACKNTVPLMTSVDVHVCMIPI